MRIYVLCLLCSFILTADAFIVPTPNNFNSLMSPTPPHSYRRTRMLAAASSVKANEKDMLLAAIDGLNYGAKASKEDQNKIESLVQALLNSKISNSAKTARVAEAFSANNKPSAARKFFNGEWQLAFTTGPDVTSIGKIPGVCLEYVGQVVDTEKNLITNKVNTSGFLADTAQEVYVKANSLSPTRVGLEFVGTKIAFSRILGRDELPFIGKVADLKPIEITFDKDKFDAQRIKSGRPAPSFEVCFMDSDLRIQRTGEGYIFIIRKVSPVTSVVASNTLLDQGLGPWLTARIGDRGMKALGLVSLTPYLFFAILAAEKLF